MADTNDPGASFFTAEYLAEPSAETLAQDPQDAAAKPSELTRAVVPFSHQISSLGKHTSLTPLVCDRRAIARLLGLILEKRGLTVGEAARRLGVRDEAVRQYVTGRRSNPSLEWFAKFCQMAGVKVSIEF